MRGKHLAEVEEGKAEGITPAHAGKTHLFALTKRPFPDHPRACGENASQASMLFATVGSPPRMRGKLSPFRFFQTIQRITPAHAGKTRRSGVIWTHSRDHPRACGENGKVAGIN